MYILETLNDHWNTSNDSYLWQIYSLTSINSHGVIESWIGHFISFPQQTDWFKNDSRLPIMPVIMTLDTWQMTKTCSNIVKSHCGHKRGHIRDRLSLLPIFSHFFHWIWRQNFQSNSFSWRKPQIIKIRAMSRINMTMKMSNHQPILKTEHSFKSYGPSKLTHFFNLTVCKIPALQGREIHASTR